MNRERVIRNILNLGKVDQGIVVKKGVMSETVSHQIKPQPGLLWNIVEKREEVSGFVVEMADGSTHILHESESLPVEVGDRVEFGRKIALWSKINS